MSREAAEPLGLPQTNCLERAAPIRVVAHRDDSAPAERVDVMELLFTFEHRLRLLIDDDRLSLLGDDQGRSRTSRRQRSLEHLAHLVAVSANGSWFASLFESSPDDVRIEQLDEAFEIAPIEGFCQVLTRIGFHASRAAAFRNHMIAEPLPPSVGE